MAASASPRKPSVPMAARSSARCSLLVAWRRKAVGSCSGAMPQPLSVTRRYVMPPFSSSTDTADAPASSAFSSSSLHTLAGRSTTSPAAMRSAIWAGSCWICGIVSTPFLVFGGGSVFRRACALSFRADRVVRPYETVIGGVPCGTSGRRPLRAVYRARPVGRDPCVPPHDMHVFRRGTRAPPYNRVRRSYRADRVVRPYEGTSRTPSSTAICSSAHTAGSAPPAG